MKSQTTPKPVTLAILPLFWRLLIRFVIVIECFLLLRMVGKAPLVAVIFMILTATVQVLSIAIIFSAIVTLVCHFAVIFLIRPRLLKWRKPKVDDSASAFHLEPRETIEVDLPARMKTGRRWQSGRLMRTNKRVMFLPAAWDAEPWMIARNHVDTGEVVASPNLFWGTVRNIPPHLQITPVGEAPVSFVVPDPHAWLPDAPEAGGKPSVVSPLSLEQRVS